MKKIINIYTLFSAFITIAYIAYFGWKLYQQAMGNIPVHTSANDGMITHYSHSSYLLTILLLLCLTLLPRYVMKKLTQEIHQKDSHAE